MKQTSPRASTDKGNLGGEMLTIEKVKQMKPCPEAIEWANPVWNGKEDTEINVLNKLIECDKLNWANWLIVRVMTRPQYIKYAIYSAEQVLGIYEKKYPKDDRPRKAIEAAKEVLRADTKENRRAAYAAYAAADTADTAADTAAYSAAYAAYSADTATYAADTAAYAAYTAARAAYAADAKKQMNLKILSYGMDLLEVE